VAKGYNISRGDDPGQGSHDLRRGRVNALGLGDPEAARVSMANETFYAVAATVIPLLLIAVMATRSLRVGEFSRQAPITLLIFGLPVLAELAAFAFLFFEPVPTAAAVILAVATWAGLLSQLAVAAWWCAGLIDRAEGRPSPWLMHRPRLDDYDDEAPPVSSPPAQSPVSAPLEGGEPDADGTEPGAEMRASSLRQSLSNPNLGTCPLCGAPRPDGTNFCPRCGRYAPAEKAQG
jgi:zinc-ribbon domain